MRIRKNYRKVCRCSRKNSKLNLKQTNKQPIKIKHYFSSLLRAINCLVAAKWVRSYFYILHFYISASLDKKKRVNITIKKIKHRYKIQRTSVQSSTSRARRLTPASMKLPGFMWSHSRYGHERDTKGTFQVYVTFLRALRLSQSPMFIHVWQCCMLGVWHTSVFTLQCIAQGHRQADWWGIEPLILWAEEDTSSCWATAASGIKEYFTKMENDPDQQLNIGILWKNKRERAKSLIVVVFSPQGSGLNYKVTGTWISPLKYLQSKNACFPHHQQNICIIFAGI